MQFIGRKQELEQLDYAIQRNSANLIVVKGRRRIGKSRLIAEFAERFTTYSFMGLPPKDGQTAQDQRNEFIRLLKKQFNLSTIMSEDWGELFSLLADLTNKGRVVIIFDEISWMAEKDPLFLGKLKNVWDMQFSKNSKLVLFLCGSISSWIDNNILKSTGFLGRPSMHITVEGLPLADCVKFWGNKQKQLSSYEKLKLLAVTGGVPRYLELINPNVSSEENIRNLCFRKNSPLFEEFDRIFSDVYGKRSNKYQEIVTLLAKSHYTREQLIAKLDLTNSGITSEYLDDLETGGFIARDYSWSLKTHKQSNLSIYRLKDNYTRFYLKYILPNKQKISKGRFEDTSINNLPGWDSIMGLQFENLVLNNSNKILQLLAVRTEDLIEAGPFFQRATNRKKGCQVDFLVQTKHDTVYVCEIKFSRNEIMPKVIEEVQEKITSIEFPRHVSRRAVLIHVNGVNEQVLENDFFSSIIDFSQFLEDE